MQTVNSQAALVSQLSGPEGNPQDLRQSGDRDADDDDDEVVETDPSHRYCRWVIGGTSPSVWLPSGNCLSS